MINKDEMIKRRDNFLSLNQEEQAEDLKRSFYELVDNALKSIFKARRMHLLSFPEDRKEVDTFITTKSHELMDKYDNMSEEDLLLSAIAQIASGLPDVDEIGKLLK